MVRHLTVLGTESHDFRVFSVAFAFSFLFHVTLLVIAGYLPGKDVSKRRLPSVINVNLASLPLQQLSSELPGKPDAKPHSKPKRSTEVKEKPPVEKTILPKVEPKPKIEPKEEPPPPPEIVVKKEAAIPVAKPKTSMKKQTYEPEKVLEKAREKIEKEVADSSQRALSERIRALEKEVEETEVEVQEEENDAGEGGGAAGAAMGVPGGAQGMSLEDTYLNIVAFHIQKNWNFSEQLAGNAKGLVVAIIFKIMPDGEIRDIWVEKRSGNNYLDESAMKAIEKSSPVQPHPAGLGKPYITGALEFTPTGIQ